MSDLTELLDNAADLLRTLWLVERAHNMREADEVDILLYALDPVDIRNAERDLRELCRKFGGGSIGRSDGTRPTAVGLARPRLVSDEPSAPGYSVKV